MRTDCRPRLLFKKSKIYRMQITGSWGLNVRTCRDNNVKPAKLVERGDLASEYGDPLNFGCMGIFPRLPRTQR